MSEFDKLQAIKAGGGASRVPLDRKQSDMLQGALQTAVAKGLVSADEVHDINDQSTLVQRMLFLDGPEANNSGSTLQTIGDVLFVGSYFGRAVYDQILGAGTTDNFNRRAEKAAEGDWGALASLATGMDWEDISNRGFWNSSMGLSSFVDSWRNKKTFSEALSKMGVFGDSDMARFGGGLAADIALDPTTYLTFGISAGVKVAPSLALRTGRAAGLRESLTLTHFGKKMYQMAAEELAPKFAEEMGTARHLVDGPMAPRWHQMVSDHMLQNFDSLKNSLLTRQRQGFWGKLKSAAGPLTHAGKEALAAKVATHTRGLVGLSADDMFRETASAAFSEFGLINSSGLQKGLASLSINPGRLVKETIDVGRPFRWVFNTFDRGWNVPPDVVEQARLGYYATNHAVRSSLSRYMDVFGKLDESDRKMVSKIIEARALRGTAAESLGSHAPVAPHLEEPIKFFETEMKSILDQERAAGFFTDSVEGYVNHVYSFSPNIKNLVLGILKKNGELDPGTFNAFSRQRMIASIAEGTEIFGEGSMIEDAYKLLAIRKKASVELIHKDMLYRYVVDKHGVPAAILHATAQGADDGLIRGFFRRAATGSQAIVDVRQVYKAEHGALKRLGFSEGDFARNRALLSYLSMPLDRTGRLGEKGIALAEKLGLSDETRLWQVEKQVKVPVKGLSNIEAARGVKATSLPTSFRPVHVKAREAVGELGSPTGATGVSRSGPDFSVDTMMAMLESHHHPAWDAVLSHAVGRKTINWENLWSVVKGFDRFTKGHLESQLPGMIPDVEQRIWRAVELFAKKEGIKLTKEKSRNWMRRIGAGVDEMRTPMELRKLEPQLPDSLIKLAEATREAFGLKVDRVPFSAEAKVEMLDRARKLGFSDKPLKEFIRLLLGKEKVETAAEMDLVHEALGAWTERLKVGEKGETWRKGEKTVKVTVSFQRSENIPLQELTAPRRAFPAGSGRLSPKSALGAVLNPEMDAKTGVMMGVSEPIYETGAGATRIFEKDAPVAGLGMEPGRIPERIAPIDDKQLVDIGDMLAPPAKDVLKEEEAAYQRMLDSRNPLFQDAQKLKKELLRMSKERIRLGELAKKAREAAKKSPSPETKLARKGAIARHRDAAQNWRAAKSLFTKSHIEADGELISYKEILKREAERTPIIKAQRLKVRDAMKKVSQEERATAASSREGFEGGGIKAPSGKAVFKPSRKMEDARKTLKSLPTSEATAQASARYQAALRAFEANPSPEAEQEVAAAYEAWRSSDRGLLEQELKLSTSIRDRLGALRSRASAPPLPSTPIQMEVYVPESIAHYLNDLAQPGIDPRWSKAIKTMVQKYDQFANWTRSNRMLPHGGYWMRNVYSSVGTNLLSTGLSMLNPRGGFSNMRDWSKAFAYSLLVHSDLASRWGLDATKAAKRAAEWGEDVIEAANGRTIKIKDFVTEAGIRGTFGGIGTAEMLDQKIMGKVGSSLSGASAGTAVGALAGAVAGPAGSGVGSLMGGIAGAYLGARKHLGGKPFGRMWGIPVPTRDGVTGLLQSNWKPLVEIGDAVTEAPFRLAHFLTTYKKTGSLYESTQRLIEHMNDWFQFSAAERQFARRIFPLTYSWTKKALTSSIRQALESPQRVRNLFSFVRDWNEGEEEGPDFLNNSFALLGEVPWGSSREPVAVSGFGIGIEDVANLMTPLTSDKPLQKMADVLIQRGPLGFTSLLEYTSNRDSFTGGEIQADPGETSRFERGSDWRYAPDWLKTIVKYQPAADGQQERVDPRMSWLIGELPISRFLQYSQLMYDKQGELNSTMLARQMLGTSIYRIDPETNRYFENRARIERMATLLDNIGRVSKYQRYYTEKQKKATRIP